MALDTAKIGRIRAGMPALQGQAYLNWGGSGPNPAPILRKVHGFLDREAALGPFHPEIRAAFTALKGELRANIAGALGARPDEIALAENTTDGINIAAAGLDWKKGDEVLVSDLEHPGGYLPWLLWRERKGIRVRLLATGASDEELLENLRRALGPRTRALCVSHIDWLTGRRLPLGKIGHICRKAGVLFAVDGAQSCGQIAVDIRKTYADVYTLSGQKWLMGPQGTGAAFIRRGLGKTLNAAKAGYHSAQKKNLKTLLFEPFPGARRFESSTLSPALISGLNEAVALWRRNDPAAIEKRIARLTQRALDGLSTIRGVECLTPAGRPAQSGLVSFRIRGMDAGKAAAILLKKHKIVLRAVAAEPPAIRASIHYLNTGKEIGQLISAVHQLATRK